MSIYRTIKNFIRKYVLGSLRVKLMISSLLPVLFIIALGIISFRMTSDSIKEKVTSSSLQSIKSADEYLKLAMLAIEAKSSETITSTHVREFFTVDPNTLELEVRTNLIQSITNFLNAKTINDKFISRYTIIGEYGFMTSGTGEMYQLHLKDIKDTEFFKKLEEADGKAVWLGCHEELEIASNIDLEKSLKISCSRVLKNPMTNKIFGIVVIDIKPEFAKTLLDSINLGEGSEFHIISPDGYDFSNDVFNFEGNKRNIAREFSELDFYKEIENSGLVNGSMNVTYKNEKYIALYSKIPETGFTLVGLIPEATLLADANSIRLVTILAVIFASALAICTGFFMSNGMGNTIKKIMTGAKSVASGNLMVNLKSDRSDELGVLSNSINSTITGMKELIAKIADSAFTVSASASEVAQVTGQITEISNNIYAAMEEISKGADEQAADAEESVEKMSQLAERINNVTVSTEKIKELVSIAAKHTVQGLSSMGELDAKAGETTDITNDILHEIKSLETHSNNIGMIVNVIREIAEQTNLLSLNASIEAARAGNMGKGFAVVAHEIKKLAEQSKSAAVEINNIITGIQKQTSSASEKTQLAEDLLKQHKRAVKNTTDCFNNISWSMDDLVKQVDIILGDVHEMEKYKEDTLKAIMNISSVSQQSAASVQEINVLSEEQFMGIQKMAEYVSDLNSVSHNLSESIKVFKI